MPFATMLQLPAVSDASMRLSDEDRQRFRAVFDTPFSIAAGTDVVREAATQPRVIGIETGWLACYTLLPQGRRQVIRFRVPGDMVGLRDLLLARASHSTVALTRVAGRSASSDAFLRLLAENSRLAVAVIWMMGREEGNAVESLVTLGQRSAAEAIAVIVHDIARRLDRIGLVRDGSFDMPVSQALLADAVGISAVHVSRSLRALREAGILEMRGQRVRILSEAGLARLVAGDGIRLPG